jgi:putative pyoverdin transport system ATP-binding/permease protein
MRLLGILFRRSPRDLLVLSALGVIGGASTAAMLAVIDRAVTAGKPGPALLAGFVLVAILKIASGIGSNLMLVRLAQETCLSLAGELSLQVLRSPFRQLESLGTGRILATLTDDVALLAAAILTIPSITVQLAVLTGCAVYLVWLSPFAFLAILALGSAGALGYRVVLARAYAANRLARKQRDALFGHFRQLIDGVKELKLNRSRRTAFVDEQIGGTTRALARLNVHAMRQFAIADAWSQGLFLLVLFTLLCGLAAPNFLSPRALTGYLFAAIYCMAPIWGLLGALPAFNQGQIAWERISELGITLRSTALAPDAPIAPPAESLTPPCIEFRDVRFKYDQEAGGFELGPLDFRIEPGQLVFIIGGNGSGKSTLVKLLTGLYSPDSGEIRVDGVPLPPDGLDQYRQLFSAVFSDFYLSDRLHAAGGVDAREPGEQLLRSFGLDRKVSIEDNRFSTINLSQGQRRRLALLSAYLEDRPVYVLDEWAADQDPAFRQVFYHQLLQDLKSRGKTVIVITHDDRYFGLGDRLMKLDYGQLVDAQLEGQPAPSTNAATPFGAPALHE